MEGVVEEQQQQPPQQQQTELIGSSTVVPALAVVSTDDPTKSEQPAVTSLVQSLLQDQADEKDGKKKKKKKKAKTGRQKELERLTKATKGIFTSPEKLNVVCERIHVLLTEKKKMLLEICRVLDKQGTGYLSWEQFRLIMKDRMSHMTREDLYVLMKLFEIEGSIDYPAILDNATGNGILRHVTQLPVPPSKEIVLEKKLPKELRRPFNEPFQFNHPKYVTLYLRLITFESYNAYPGHIHLTVPDHMSVYVLSKMVIDETDLATRSISIFREKVRSRNSLLDPTCSLEQYDLTGAYVDGTHKQTFPTYTLYYDYSPLDLHGDCPILKCDHFMK